MCQGFSHFSGSLHHFVLGKLATSSIRVKRGVFSDIVSSISERKKPIVGPLFSRLSGQWPVGKSILEREDPL